MFIGLLSWWYGNGWASQWKRLGQLLVRTEQHFSMRDLLFSLFSPFRQISAAGASGSFQAQLRNWADRQVSRFVGFFLRVIVLIVGGLAVLVMGIIGAIALMALWPLVPLLPLAAVALWLMGVTI